MGHTVPQLIAELRQKIEQRTKRPIDPDIDFLTTQIEMISASGPLVGLDDPVSEHGLTKAERRIFNRLASAPGKVFTKNALMNALYFDNDGDEPHPKIIDVLICKVRGKIRNSPQAVETVWGEGFRLVTRAGYVGPDGRDPPDKWGEQPTFQGIRLNRVEHLIAEALYERCGEVVPHTTLAPLSGSSTQNGYLQRVRELRYKLQGKYRIVNHRRVGYELTPEHAQRAA